MSGRPPSLPGRLLAATLPPGPVGRSIRGDLIEEWHRRPAGVRRTAWYWAACLALAVRYAAGSAASVLGDAGADVRAALRRLGREPGHALLTVVALGLGVAAPSTMFSIVEGVTRLPQVPGPERVVHVGQRRGGTIGTGPLEWLRPVADGVPGLETVGVYTRDFVDLSGDGSIPQRAVAGVVMPEVLETLGVAPMLGRSLTADDARSGAPVVVVGWELWRTRFGADPDALGSTLRVDGEPRTVVGVMPEGFRYPGAAELWVPLDLDDPIRADAASFEALGRLAPGASLQEVRSAVGAIEDGLRSAGHEIQPAAGLAAQAWIHRQITAENRRMTRVMVLIVSFVLLIACADVANLLLARALARGRETGVRVALGAGRGRIVRQHLAEAGVVAAAGGVLGVALTVAGTGLFERYAAGTLAHWMDIRIDVPVLLFCAALVLVAAVLSGALPALQAGRVDVAGVLRDGDRGTSAFRIGRINQALVVGEIALSCVLLVVAGLMIRGAVLTLRTDGVYATEDVLSVRYDLRVDDYPTPGEVRDFHRRLLERVGSGRDVTGAALMSHLPGVFSARRPVELEGERYDRPEDRPWAHVATVSPGFVQALGSELLRGRDLRWSDGDGEPWAVLANEEFVRRFFPDGEALGARVRLGRSGDPAEPAPWATVVGVVPALGVDVGRERSGAGLYVPVSAEPLRGMALLVRAGEGADPHGLLPDVRGALAAMDPDVALYQVGSLADHITGTRVAEAIFAVLFALFGMVGLLLAAIGLYGLLAFTVRRRTRELGVRSALGAAPLRVLWAGVGRGVTQVALGLALGLGLAALLAPLLGVALLGMDPRDPLVYGVVATVLAGAGVLATLLPAKRALGVDVVEALRTE